MPYRLDLDDLPRSLVTVARREARRLEQMSRPDGDRGLAVHDHRKGLKRLRALLLLAKTDAIGQPLRHLDRHLRGRGRRLGPDRDAAVVRETFRQLVADGLIRSSVLARHIEAALEAQGTTAVETVAAADAADQRDTILQRLNALTCDAATMATVIEAVGRTYRHARRARRDAERAQTSDAFHDWRKQVQKHARHMQLLADLWPEEMAVRRAAAKSLADRLGSEHDLAALDQRLALIGVPKAQQRAMSRLRGEIARRQAALRSEALGLGNRLFAETSRVFRARLTAYRAGRADPAAPATKIDAADPPRLVPARRLGYQQGQGDGDA